MLITRDKIIELSYKERDGKILAPDVIELLQSYCRDKAPSINCIVGEKEQAAIDQCIQHVLTTGAWQLYWKKALSYYKVQYTIYELYSRETDRQTPLGPQKVRELLQIF